MAAEPDDTGLGGMRWHEALARTRHSLEGAGIDDAALDARLLAAAAFGTDMTGLLVRAGDVVDAGAAAVLAAHTRRRLAREPVGRILGRREFWGLPFALAPETLEPRPDTETLVEAALALFSGRDPPRRILDLGTGSGCLLVALLSEFPQARGIGIDRSLAAARTARFNAGANGVGTRASLLCGDWAHAVSGGFDLIVSNPPYIPAGTIAGLAAEVSRYDPRLALDGGRDGLDAYRAILPQLQHALLAPEGAAILEIGFDQASDLARLADGIGLDLVSVRRDLGGRDRAVTLVQRERLA